jgi:hypothetical protein
LQNASAVRLRRAPLLVEQIVDLLPRERELDDETAAEITRTPGEAGESALGILIADAQRVAVAADFAFMNPGGIRADLPAGTITWGALSCGTARPLRCQRTDLRARSRTDAESCSSA